MGKLLTGMAVALAFACLVRPAAGMAEVPVFDGPLVTEGRNFVDPEGRTVVMHGLMGVWKQAPYIPSGDNLEGAVPTFTESDADIVEDMGLNAMRLAWFWQGLEPTAGTYDEDYLNGIDGVESKLADRDIYSVLDSHQDQYNKLFGDKPGFPEWTSPVEGGTFDGLPIAPPTGEAGYALWKFPLGYGQPSTGRAFGHLYADRELSGGRSIQEAYGDAWKEVVGRFKSHPMVVGYDLMNEPWPSTVATGTVGQCATPAGCSDWDRNVLQPLFNSLAASVREVDTDRPVFYEPTIYFNSGSVNHFQPPPAGLGPVGLSFHNQCSTRTRYSISNPKDPAIIEEGHTTCPKEEARVMHNADDTAARLGGPALMTEVAPTADSDSQGLNCLLERADYFKTGFTYGLSWSNPNKELRHLADDSKAGKKAPFKLQVLARVYPRAIAGTAEKYGFDVRTGKFEMTYTPDHSITAPTAVSVPAAIQYPDGFQVSVTGGHVVSDPGADVVLVAADPGAGKVQVTITANPGDMVRPAFPACVMDPKEAVDPDPDPTPDPDTYPDPQPKGTVAASIRSVSPRTIKGLRRRGKLVARVRCDQKCGMSATLRVNRSTARRMNLKIRRGTPLPVAVDHASGRAGKDTIVVLKLGRPAKKGLKKLKKVTMNLQIKVTAAGLKPKSLRRRLSFR